MVLATGGCAFLSKALGCNVLTGDGYLLGAEVGAEPSGMEFSNAYGLGSFLVAAREVFRMELVLAGVLLLALVGYGLCRLSKFLFQRFLPWQVL